MVPDSMSPAQESDIDPTSDPLDREVAVPNKRARCDSNEPPPVDHGKEFLSIWKPKTVEKKSELELYLASTDSIEQKEDPFDWWSKACRKFPKIGLVALCHLPIPATQASSERVFSLGNEALRPRRIRMEANRLARIAILKKNIPYYQDIIKSDTASSK